MDLAAHAGWWWPFANVCILTPKVSVLYRDERNRLHCVDGPAVSYGSSWHIYAWHGVRVTHQIIEQPETITIEQIKGEQNAERRRVMIARYGYDRYVRDAGAKVIHKDDWGTLYQLPDNSRVVEVVNATMEPDGTFKRYWLGVRPDATKAIDAVASTFVGPDGRRMTGEEYAQRIVAHS